MKLTYILLHLSCYSVSLAAVFHRADNGSRTDLCWAQWSRYWSMSEEVVTKLTTYSKTLTEEVYTYWVLPTFRTTAWATTVTEKNGNFPTKTFITTIQSTDLVWESFSSWTTTATELVTSQLDHVFNQTFPWHSSTITPPPCTLPTSVPQCQSSWESWVAHGQIHASSPICTQARITGSFCNTVQSSWLEHQLENNGETSGKVGLWAKEVTITISGTPTISWSRYWPTSSTIIPGCTVGCQSCKISGSNVKLLYWPPRTRDGDVTASQSDSGPVTAISLGTTLTSPTVYLSFDRLHASNSCKIIGSTLRNIIVPIANSATLSSLYGWGRYFGGFQTASFNFTDLYTTSVPDDIYQSQPRCASSKTSLEYSCLSLGTTGPPLCQSVLNNSFRCPRTLPYEPVISIPVEVQNLLPEWADCIGGLEGVYDPPSALQPALSIATPTWPQANPSTTATTSLDSDAFLTTTAKPLQTPSQIAPHTQDSIETGNVPSSSALPNRPSSTKSTDVHSTSSIHSPQEPVETGEASSSSPADDESFSTEGTFTVPTPSPHSPQEPIRSGEASSSPSVHDQSSSSQATNVAPTPSLHSPHTNKEPASNTVAFTAESTNSIPTSSAHGPHTDKEPIHRPSHTSSASSNPPNPSNPSDTPHHSSLKSAAGTSTTNTIATPLTTTTKKPTTTTTSTSTTTTTTTTSTNPPHTTTGATTPGPQESDDRAPTPTAATGAAGTKWMPWREAAGVLLLFIFLR